MAKVVIIHVVGEDPILAEMEDLPKPSDQFVEFTNPRRRDGKPIAYVTTGAKAFLLPWHRLSFVEVMTTETEREEVVEFFREDR
jgi:hypothetical protein